MPDIAVDLDSSRLTCQPFTPWMCSLCATWTTPHAATSDVWSRLLYPSESGLIPCTAPRPRPAGPFATWQYVQVRVWKANKFAVVYELYIHGFAYCITCACAAQYMHRHLECVSDCRYVRLCYRPLIPLPMVHFCASLVQEEGLLLMGHDSLCMHKAHRHST